VKLWHNAPLLKVAGYRLQAPCSLKPEACSL
jgi:hypothetical protein